jgi:hypothetical protein
VTLVLKVPDLSDGTGCESEGAFTPTKIPCNRMCKDRPKAGNVDVSGHVEQIRMSGNGLKAGAVAGNERSQRSCRGALITVVLLVMRG